MTESGLDALFAPRSIAIVGASDDTSKYGGRLLSFLVRHGYPGRVVPVHSSARTVQGLPAVATIDDLGQPVDLAVVSVPADAVAGVVTGAARRGTRAVVILSSGFAEDGPPGEHRQEALMAAVAGSGLRVLGPNCLGLVVPPERLVLSPSFAFDVAHVPVGRIALVAQSGAVMTSVFSRGLDAGIGLRLGASVGNQADVDVCDVIEFGLTDPATAAVCAYVEGFPDPGRFAALAARCRMAEKPLLMVKGGSTDLGARAVSSHTASLAGSYEVFAAVCREQQVDLLDDPEAMIECAAYLDRWGGSSGGGVAIVSNSGGHGVLASDRVGRAELPLAHPTAATIDRLAQLLPTSRSPNPVDVGGLARGRGPSVAAQVVDALQQDPSVSATLVVLTTSVDLAGLARAIGMEAARARKPVVVCLVPGSAADEARVILRELSIPFVNRIDDAIRVCRVVTRPRLPGPDRDAAGTETQDARHWAGMRAELEPLPPGPLSGPEAEDLLVASGVRVPDGAVATTLDDAVLAAARLGPVAMKLVARDISHKSDVGGVRLDVRGRAAVAGTWDALRSIVDPGAFIGVHVQAMIDARAELIVGIRRDPGFGPYVLIGAGGRDVEAHRDFVLVPAPVSAERAHELILSLRIAPLLGPWRGLPPADVAAAADVVRRLGQLAVALGDRLVELEINPLALLAAGSGAIALDARGQLAEATSAPIGSGT